MIYSISVTCKDLKEARKISRVLLRSKLVGCANIIPNVESHYWWQGKIVKDIEVLLIFKTVSKNAAKTKKEIIRLHSYEVPCLTIQKVETNSESDKWLRESVE